MNYYAMPPEPPVGLFIVVAALLLSAALAVGWWRAARRARRAEASLRQLQDAKVATAEPDANMRHAIDAIALEVERIGEGQRFITGVLAKRTEVSEDKNARR